MEVVTILGHQIAVETLDTLILLWWTFVWACIGFGVGMGWQAFKGTKEYNDAP